ncbi:MAG: DUF4290 domain-containing protein [Cyclobacteriaceae bacterium]
MEYNTQRDNLLLREYGRNVQRMVSYLLTIEDQEKRNSYAGTIVELMKHLNPNVKDSPEYDQKVWDDLFIISGFELEAQGPYPKPAPEVLDKKPNRVHYQNNPIKYRHYGRSLEILIERACKLTDPEDKKGAVVQIGKLMKSFYLTWNKDQIEDEQVLKTIKKMTDNQLDIDIEEVKEYKLFDMDRPASSGQQHRNRGGGPKHRNGRKGNNNNNRRRRN